MNAAFLCIVLFLSVLSLASSFSGVKSIPSFALKTTNTLSTSKLFAKKPAPATPAGYWEGEWICADCGYVYDREVDGGGTYFEDLKKGFICPQCSAPRRRYAKKVGDQWGVTQDGGDFPIYLITFVGLAVTTWFALVYVPTM